MTKGDREYALLDWGFDLDQAQSHDLPAEPDVDEDDEGADEGEDFEQARKMRFRGGDYHDFQRRKEDQEQRDREEKERRERDRDRREREEKEKEEEDRARREKEEREAPKKKKKTKSKKSKDKRRMNKIEEDTDITKHIIHEEIGHDELLWPMPDHWDWMEPGVNHRHDGDIRASYMYNEELHAEKDWPEKKHHSWLEPVKEAPILKEPIFVPLMDDDVPKHDEKSLLTEDALMHGKVPLEHHKGKQPDIKKATHTQDPLEHYQHDEAPKKG